MTSTSQTWLYRHDELIIPRPYGVDVDEHDWMWEGCGTARLIGHNLRTAALRVIPLPQMGHTAIYQVFCWHGKLVLTLGNHPFYLVYDPATGKCIEQPIPTAKPIVWYGTKTPNGKIILFERSESKALILDAPDAPPRAVPCPFQAQLSHGIPCSDGFLYSAVTDPCRLLRFDLAKEKFVEEIPAPFANSGFSGQFEHRGILYGADSSHGRLLAFDLAKSKWLEPIPVPDYRKVYGYIGGGFGFQGKGYFCLSTYAHQSRLDPKIGRIIVPEGVPLAIDGRPPRFMERFLVFDPDSGKFDYLVAPEQPDGMPLLCYSWADDKRFVITGIVIPWKKPGEPGGEVGPYIVLQNAPAAEEPGFDAYDFGFDLAAHVRQYRRGYSRERALYIPHLPWTQPISNSSGPATEYPPGRDAELLRRAAKTDPARYWKRIVDEVCRGLATDSERVRAILRFVRTSTYYNPIQVQTHSNPVALLEGRDIRCGQAVQILRELFAAAGIESRTTGLSHHTVAEAFYDGAWHLADALFFGSHQPSRDGRALSVEELKADPYFADGFPQECFAYDPELLLAEDGHQVLGYVFGPWGSYEYYSYYLDGAKENPPTIPTVLPVVRESGNRVRLRWAESAKRGGGTIEFEVRVLSDRDGKEQLFQTTTKQTSVPFEVPEQHRMYFIQVRAMDDHRQKNPNTWYPVARSNFVLAPPDAYGWYGVM